jgi:hypothetical protein
MRKLTLIIVVLIFSKISFGKENKISIGISGAVNVFNFDTNAIDKFLDSEYRTSSAYSFGINLKYLFKEKFFVKGVVGYSKMGYYDDYNMKARIIFVGRPYPKKTTKSLSYIGIHTFIGYNVYNGNRFKIAPSIGLINEFLIKDKETSLFSDGVEKESNSLDYNPRDFVISSQLNLAIEYHISSAILIGIEPYLRLRLSSVNDIYKRSRYTLPYGASLYINYKL